MNLNGGGILPVALDESGSLQFLFGLERDYWIDSIKGWCDFGGKSDLNELRIDTACRECEEETNGFLGNIDDLKKIVNNNLILKIETAQYDSYVVYIKYDQNLPIYFNRNYKCIEKYQPELLEKSGLFEKREIKWFSIDEIIISELEFRKFYWKEFISIILDKKNNIKKKIDCFLKKDNQNEKIKTSISLLNIKLLEEISP